MAAASPIWLAWSFKHFGVVWLFKYGSKGTQVLDSYVVCYMNTMIICQASTFVLSNVSNAWVLSHVPMFRNRFRVKANWFLLYLTSVITRFFQQLGCFNYATFTYNFSKPYAIHKCNFSTTVCEKFKHLLGWKVICWGSDSLVCR